MAKYTKDDVKFTIVKRIRENIDKWSWSCLSKNEVITMDIIEENADLPWSKNQIVLNQNLTWNFIIKHIEYYKKELWTWQFISAHKCVTMEIVKSHPDLPWNYYFMSRNQSITIDDVLERINLPWDWLYLSINPNMTWDIICAHELPWDFDRLSGNPNITWEIIKNNPQINWNYKHFRMNVNLTDEIVKNNPGIKLVDRVMINTHFLNTCPWYVKVTELTWEMLNNPIYNLSIDNIFWNRSYCIYLNPNTTWDVIKDNPDKPWDYSVLSKNTNITFDIVRDNPDKSWDYSVLSTNRNITWDVVLDNSHIAWDWVNLSSNPGIFKLTDQDVKFISTVRYIQKRWRDVLYNPKYVICRKRIMREFSELGEI
jgi:hypothetical protein